MRHRIREGLLACGLEPAAQAFKSISGFNSRYVQPLNGREVIEDSSTGQ